MMAGTPERMDFLRLAHAKGRCLGMETEIITPGEAAAMFPLMDPSHFVGALWDPVEGHLDPSGTTHAYAKAAQKLGATIVLRNRVVELTQEPDGAWNVVTEHGTVEAEHVVNAGGLWAREVGRMVGLELPLLAMEHMYLLTEPMRGGGGVQRPDRARDGRRARPARRDLHPAGAGRGAARHLRAGLQAVVAEDDAVGLRPRTAAARPRPDRAVARGRVPALPGAGERRDQAGDQRAVHLRAGRQPAGRAGAGADQLLGGLRGDGRASARAAASGWCWRTG